MKHWMLANSMIALTALAVAVSAVAEESEAHTRADTTLRWECVVLDTSGRALYQRAVAHRYRAGAEAYARSQVAADVTVDVACGSRLASLLYQRAGDYAAADHTHDTLTGPPGPQGERGPAGPQGERGPRGETHSHHLLAQHDHTHYDDDEVCFDNPIPGGGGRHCHGIRH